jgi:hypothetical protein
MPAIRLWHAAILGGFAVAWATGDEDTYAMHFFAGWLVVAVVALRLAAALLARPGSLLSLNRPNRGKAMALGIVVTLALTGLAGVSGAIADVLPFFEDPHEGLAVMALWAVGAHVAVVLFVYKGRQWLRRLSTAALALAVVSPALAGEPARDAIMAAYEKQARAADPAFAGFSAQRGEALYKARYTANPNIASCSTCHTDDPRGMGRHAKTGRAIEPVAVSANPKRFLDAEKVDERFTRDCKSIMGRVCTPTEKGDYLTFLISR